MAAAPIFANTTINGSAPDITGIPYVDQIIAGSQRGVEGPVDRPKDAGEATVEVVGKMPAGVPKWVWIAGGLLLVWWMMKGRK